MFRKTIGILGGMGPVASADTYVELTRLCQRKYGAVQDSDYPKMLLYSLPLAEFDHRGFTKKTAQKKILSQLTSALSTLQEAGSDVIIIDCNTVHCLFNDLQVSTIVPIINLIEVTVQHIVDHRYRSVGLLCSQTSRDVKLYAAPLKKKGVEVLMVSQKEQEFLNEAILAVMSGQVTFKHVAKIDALIDQLVKKGAHCIILGCTEISNLARQLTHHAVLVDSEVLALERALVFAR